MGIKYFNILLFFFVGGEIESVELLELEEID